MRKYLLLLILCSLAMYAFAQRDTIGYAKTADGRVLTAHCLDFRKKGAAISVSPDNRLLLVKLYDVNNPQKGFAVMHDLRTDSVLWGRPIKVLTDGTRITPHGLLVEDAWGGVQMMSLRDMEDIWRDKMRVVTVNDSLDVILGYKSATSSKLRALKMSTGELLWEKKVPHARNWGWDDISSVGDSLLLVVADNVNFINPLTGDIKVHEAKTGYEDVGNALLQGLGAVALGVAAGLSGYYVYYTPYVGASVVTHTSSNVLHRNGRYFVSDRNSLMCLDGDANEVWTQQFPARTVGYSRLFSYGDTLFMANYAFGLRGGMTMKKVGRPFLAAFEAQAGRQLFMNYLSTDKDMVEGAAITPEGAFLMFDDGLAYQALTDSVVNIQAWNVNAYGRLIAMPNDTLYVFRQNDNALTPLHHNARQCVVITDKGKLLVVDNHLNITDDYLSKNVYHIKGRTGSRCLVGTNPIKNIRTGKVTEPADYWIVEESGLPVAHVEVPVDDYKLVGDMLYLLSENKVIIVNILEQ